MIQPGKYATLKVGLPTQGGVLLKDAQGYAVLLPDHEYEKVPVSGRYLPVFVYQNNKGVLTATLSKPLVELGQAAALTIKSVTDAGAFADWGLDKDILIPFKEQAVRMVEGNTYIIAIYLDPISGRLAGSSRISKHLFNDDHELEEGAEVDVLIGYETKLGVTVVINNKHIGLVYHNEFFKNVSYGQATKGWIKKIRENNKIDVAIQRAGHKAVHDGTDAILTALESNRGFLPLNDKSSPEVIKEKLGMSKKLFKKTIGQLYKQRVISIHNDGIRLTNAD